MISVENHNYIIAADYDDGQNYPTTLHIADSGEAHQHQVSYAPLCKCSGKAGWRKAVKLTDKYNRGHSVCNRCTSRAGRVVHDATIKALQDTEPVVTLAELQRLAVEKLVASEPEGSLIRQLLALDGSGGESSTLPPTASIMHVPLAQLVEAAQEKLGIGPEEALAVVEHAVLASFEASPNLDANTTNKVSREGRKKDARV